MADTENTETSPVDNGSEKIDSSFKRKRTDSNDDEDDRRDIGLDENKRIKVAEDKPPVPVSSTGTVRIISETADSMVIEIPPDKVGTVIGSKGMVIQEVQMRSGAKAVVNQEFPPGVPRQVNVNGTSLQMKNCYELIKKIIEVGPTAIHVNSLSGGPSITTTIEVSQQQIGKVIGTGGNTIKEIQSKSGARVQIDQDYPPEVPRKVNISGTSTAVNIAVQLVQTILAGGNIQNQSSNYPMTPGSMMNNVPVPAYPRPSMPSMAVAPAMVAPGAEVRNTLDVAKAVIGKIIGKGGETIHSIQKKSGCKVTVDQQVPEGYPCKVNMVGTAQTVAIASYLIQEIMMGVPSSKIGANLPPTISNSAGAASMPNMSAPMGGHHQQQQQPPMGNPATTAYGMPQYQGMPFPQQSYPYSYAPQMQYPGPYGMPQPGMYPGNPYGQPTAPMAAQQPAATVGGYGAMPRAAGAYSHNTSTVPAQSRPQASPASTAKKSNSGTASVWTEHKTDDGIPYWYNASTGVSQVRFYVFE
jgi:far upstream element-binding protein